jgi:tripartite motif-containing protein 71
MMSNMLNVVDDVLREEEGIEQDMVVPLSSTFYQHHPYATLFSSQIQNHHHAVLTEPSMFNKCTQSSLPLTSLPQIIINMDEQEPPHHDLCLRHTDERLTYFCKHCMVPLCRLCIKENEHRMHPYVTIKDAFLEIQPSFSTLSTKITEQLALLNKSVASIEKVRGSILQKREETAMSMQHLFQNYREAIAKREKEVLTQLNIITDLRLNSLLKEQQDLESIKSSLLELNREMKKENNEQNSHLLTSYYQTRQLNYLNHETVPPEDDSFVIQSNASPSHAVLSSFCTITTSPHPPLCTAEGEGFYRPRINRVMNIVVHTKDRLGEICRSGGERIYATLTSLADGSSVQVDVKDNQNGSYLLKYQSHSKGEHQLVIAIRGHHIQGSPFTLVIESGKECNRFINPSIIFGKEGSQNCQFSRPWGLCCDQKGNIIVGDRSNHRIQIFDSNGVFIRSFGTHGQKKGQFNRPAGVAVTREGHIVVADKDNHRIQVLTPEGLPVHMFGSKGGNEGQMIYPYDVSVDQLDGRICVTDTGNHRILIFTHDGKLLAKFGYKGYLCNHFDSPRGITFSKDGYIIVSDFNFHHILVIHPDATTAHILGSQGNGNGQFMRPQGIAIDSAGNFIVADTRNNRVVVMQPNGKFLSKIGGGQGNGKGQFDRPTDVTVMPDGRIAVLDFGNSRIQIF